MVAPTTVRPRRAPNETSTNGRHRLIRLVADPEDCAPPLTACSLDRIEERVERLLNDLRNDDMTMVLLDLAQLHRAVAESRTTTL